MTIIKREDIHVISRHSNLSEQGIEKALRENVYNNKEKWVKFLKVFFITLGIGFTVSGIVFFFAFNWANLHKFAKIGLTQSLVLLTIVLVLVLKLDITVRKVILTGSAILIGVLFAVFGQIYQTGANAFDFFLVWTIFVTIWVVISNFAPLWLLYLILINTTLILYSQQVAKDWSEVLTCTLLFVINATALICSLLLSKYKKLIPVPNWFIYTVALASFSYATLGIIIGIFDEFHVEFPLLIFISLLVYAFGIWYGISAKDGFYLSVIPFSLVVIFSTLLIKISSGKMMLLVVSLFIVASVSTVVKNLIDIQKKWSNEK